MDSSFRVNSTLRLWNDIKKRSNLIHPSILELTVPRSDKIQREVFIKTPRRLIPGRSYFFALVEPRTTNTLLPTPDFRGPLTYGYNMGSDMYFFTGFDKEGVQFGISLQYQDGLYFLPVYKSTGPYPRHPLYVQVGVLPLAALGHRGKTKHEQRLDAANTHEARTIRSAHILRKAAKKWLKRDGDTVLEYLYRPGGVIAKRSADEFALKYPKMFKRRRSSGEDNR